MVIFFRGGRSKTMGFYSSRRHPQKFHYGSKVRFPGIPSKFSKTRGVCRGHLRFDPAALSKPRPRSPDRLFLLLLLLMGFFAHQIVREFSTFPRKKNTKKTGLTVSRTKGL